MLKIKAKNLNQQLNDMLKDRTLAVESAVNAAIGDLAAAAHASIQAKAQKALSSTRQDYLKGLKFEQLDDNSYSITLEGDYANSLEEGYAGFNITDRMLASSKTVKVGSRSGQPWVRTGKKGQKFARVPLSPKIPKGSTMSAALKEKLAIDRNGFEQKLTQIFKDPLGNPMTGKVGKSLADGITKYQEKNDYGKIQATYIAYRTVSENGDAWMHPGFRGIRAFQEAEEQLLANISKIIDSLS